MTLLVVMLVLGLQVHGSTAQTPQYGVVWTPPSSFSEMREDLEMMADFGIEAVRVDLVLEENVHLVTDMFGVELFQEIGLAFSPGDLEQTQIDLLAVQIDTALMTGHAAGRPINIGLGYWNDTSHQRMCDVISALARHVKSASGAIRTYYTTPFIENDRCSGLVDFVLLDSRTGADPRELLRRWRTAHETPAGIAALGAPVYADSRPGYQVADSPESQARYLEKILGDLRGDSDVVAVFVERWMERDPRRLESIGIDGDFGILRPDGTERPAAEVVKGFFTGEQDVFAFPAGHPGAVDYSWVNLIAFVVAALFGLMYYTSLDMRSLLRRYFVSHSFYLEKVGDGRDISTGISFFFLGCLAVMASIVGLTLVVQIQGTNVWYALTEILPESLSWSLRAGVRYPGVLLLALATIFALVAFLWSGILSALTRGSKSLGPGQALLICVMPRWPVAIVGLLVLVVLNWRLDAAVAIFVLVAVAWSTIVLSYTGRMFSDYLRLLGISAMLTIPVILLGLLLVASAGWLFVVTQDIVPDVTFLWNIATRT